MGWTFTDEPRIVHSIGSFRETTCGRPWWPGRLDEPGNPRGSYGTIAGTRDLVKSRHALTTCPECLESLQARGEHLDSRQREIFTQKGA